MMIPPDDSDFKNGCLILTPISYNKFRQVVNPKLPKAGGGVLNETSVLWCEIAPDDQNNGVWITTNGRYYDEKSSTFKSGLGKLLIKWEDIMGVQYFNVLNPQPPQPAPKGSMGFKLKGPPTPPVDKGK